MARISADRAGGNHVLAFLDMIAASEIGAALLAVSDDGYNVLVGSTARAPKLFDSYADHPNQLVTVNSKGLQSTAAGRYQFLHITWLGIAHRLALTDFSPESQDRGCIELLRECKAYPRIVAGDVRNAIHMAAPIWASLTGAGYGQHENTMDFLVDAYFDSLRRHVNAASAPA